MTTEINKQGFNFIGRILVQLYATKGLEQKLGERSHHFVPELVEIPQITFTRETPINPQGVVAGRFARFQVRPLDVVRMERQNLISYLARLGINESPDTLPANLKTLTRLMAAHCRFVPFENIDVVLNRTIEVSFPKLHAKIVRNQRGGYCLEINRLFAAALKALGFGHVTQLLCRVRINREEDDHTPSTHLTQTVTIGSTRYLCDVGFAGTQSIAPVVLGRDGHPQVLPEGRFRTTSQPGAYTMLERERNGKWDPLYKFRKDEPALSCDIEMANFYSCKFPGARFCGEFFISRRFPRADGAADDLHYILNDQYVIRRADGSATKVIVHDRAQLLTLLSERFGLRAADLDLPELTRYLDETDTGEISPPVVGTTMAAVASAKADIAPTNNGAESTK